MNITLGPISVALQFDDLSARFYRRIAPGRFAFVFGVRLREISRPTYSAHRGVFRAQHRRAE